MKLFIFDLDNTLYSYDHADQQAYKAVVSSLSECLSINQNSIDNAIIEGRKKTYETIGGHASAHAKGIHYHHALEKLTGTSNLKLVNQHEELYWTVFLQHTHIYPGVRECLQYISEHGGHNAILSNGIQRVQFSKIEKLGIETHFKHIVTSEEAGSEKPHFNSFNHLLGKYSTDILLEDVYMIGDNEIDDMQGAYGFGIPKKNIFIKKSEIINNIEYNIFTQRTQLENHIATLLTKSIK